MKKKSNDLREKLNDLKLPFFRDNFEDLIQQAIKDKWDYSLFLSSLIEGEIEWRFKRRVERRLKAARFPLVKSLETFDWNWPKQVNEMQIKNLFRLNFINQKANVIFLSTVGLGKTHLAIALGQHACHKGYSVLFATAIGIINSLSAAQKVGRLKEELKRYVKPQLLVIDELGYLPVDKKSVDFLFQVISGRYEVGSILLTTNKPFKKWPEIFNNDSTITSAVLDRLLHHSDTVILKGKSYRMKDRIES